MVPVLCGHSRNFCSSKECAQCDEPGRPLAMHRGEICARRKDACVRPQLFFHLRAVPFLDHQKLKSCDGRE
jgi:hypothetical protein